MTAMLQRTPGNPLINTALAVMLLIAALFGVPIAAAGSAHLAIGHHGTNATRAAAHQQHDVDEHPADQRHQPDHMLLHGAVDPVHHAQPELFASTTSSTVPLGTPSTVDVPVPVDVRQDRHLNRSGL
jgi:hypothetical protein